MEDLAIDTSGPQMCKVLILQNAAATVGLVVKPNPTGPIYICAPLEPKKYKHLRCYFPDSRLATVFSVEAAIAWIDGWNSGRFLHEKVSKKPKIAKDAKHQK